MSLSPQPVGQPSAGDYDPRKPHAPTQGNAANVTGPRLLPARQNPSPAGAGARLLTVLLAAGREKFPAAAGATGRSDLFDDPSYVNVQNVDKTRQTPAAGSATANGSAQRDLFDMSERGSARGGARAGGGCSRRPSQPPVCPSRPAEPFEDALRAPPAAGLPPAQVVASMEEQLRREPWYHGKMNRKDAEKLLKVNGDFLVRESTTTPGQYVLTGLQGGQPKHLLLVDPEGVVSAGGHAATGVFCFLGGSAAPQPQNSVVLPSVATKVSPLCPPPPGEDERSSF